MLAITKSNMARELSYIRHFRKNSETLNHQRKWLISSIDRDAHTKCHYHQYQISEPGILR